MLSQIFGNALKYAGKNGGIVEIAGWKDEEKDAGKGGGRGKVHLAVRDNGGGAPLEDIPFLFDKGFTGNHPGRQNATGMGLYFVKKYAKLLGADVRVDQAQEILVNKNKNLDDFGHLLDETWNLKKKTGTIISNDSIDHFYRRGIDAGALGGKLLGAGGGGFLIFYVDIGKREAVKNAMKDLMYIPFEFENSGTKVIHYTPEVYEPQRYD